MPALQDDKGVSPRVVGRRIGGPDEGGRGKGVTRGNGVT